MYFLILCRLKERGNSTIWIDKGLTFWENRKKYSFVKDRVRQNHGMCFYFQTMHTITFCFPLYGESEIGNLRSPSHRM